MLELLRDQFQDPNAYIRFTNAVQPPAVQFLLVMFLLWYVQVSVKDGWLKTFRWLWSMVFNTTGGSFAIAYVVNLLGSWISTGAIAAWHDAGADMAAFPWFAVTLGRSMIFASYLCTVRILAPNRWKNYFWIVCAAYCIWDAATPYAGPTTLASTAVMASFVTTAAILFYDRHRIYWFIAKRWGRGARIHYSADGRFYYCTVSGRPGDKPKHWFEVTTSMCPINDAPTDTFEPVIIETFYQGEKYCRRAFPFAFFRHVEGRVERLNDTNRHLFNDYAAYHGWAPYREG